MGAEDDEDGAPFPPPLVRVWLARGESLGLANSEVRLAGGAAGLDSPELALLEDMVGGEG